MYVNPAPDAACVSRHPANKITKTVIPGEGSAKLWAKLLEKKEKKNHEITLTGFLFFGFLFFFLRGKKPSGF